MEANEKKMRGGVKKVDVKRKKKKERKTPFTTSFVFFFFFKPALPLQHQQDDFSRTFLACHFRQFRCTI